MAWSDRASNMAVSYTDLQTSGFNLKSGQSHVTSDLAIHKSAALAKYNLQTTPMDAWGDNNLVPKSAFVGIFNVNCGTQFQLTYDSSGWFYEEIRDIIVSPNSGTVNIDYAFEPYPETPGSATIKIQVQYEGGTWVTLLDEYVSILSTVSGTVSYSFVYNTSTTLKVKITRADT